MSENETNFIETNFIDWFDRPVVVAQGRSTNRWSIYAKKDRALKRIKAFGYYKSSGEALYALGAYKGKAVINIVDEKTALSGRPFHLYPRP